MSNLTDRINKTSNENELRDLKIILDIEKALGIEYSDEQIDVLLNRGNMCVLACAGSGKTSVVTSMITKRILSGEISNQKRLLCTTYSKDGALEMESRLSELLSKFGIQSQVTVKTIHAFCYAIINYFYPDYYTVITEAKKLAFLRECCADAKFKPAEDDLSTLSTLISYQINNLLSDNSTYNSPAFNIENMTLEQYSSIRIGYSTKKREKRLLDFDDMQFLVWINVVKNKAPSVIAYCKSLFDHCYVDEAQDMSLIQYQIIRALVTDINDQTKLEKVFVLVGDDDQCIYKWRGAEPKILLDVTAEFEIKRYVLSTNYRCKSEIVNLAAHGVKYNKQRSEKTMHADQLGGAVTLVDSNCNNLYDMTVLAFDHIKELVDSGVSESDIAVLSRNNFHLEILASLCFKNGIYCTASNDMKLTNSIMYKDIKAIIGLIKDPYNASNIGKVLWKMISYLGYKTATNMSDFQKKSGTAFKDCIAFILKECLGYPGIEFEHQANIPAIVKERAKMQFQGMPIDCAKKLYTIYSALTEYNDTDALKILLTMYADGSTSFIYKSEDKSRTVIGLVRYFQTLLCEYNIDKLSEFLRMTEQVEAGEVFIPGSKVTLSTMHSSKGREWKHVILFGDDNVSLPSFSRIRALIASGMDSENLNSYINEDRRLHYVACTRAKEDLTIITSSKNMGLFLIESLGLLNTNDNNTSIMEMAQSGSLAASVQHRVDRIFKRDGSLRKQITVEALRDEALQDSWDNK